MMIIKDCEKCKKDYMYDPNQIPLYDKLCQECFEIDVLCNDDCQLFRWGKCQTKDKEGHCDLLDMYDCDDLDFKRIK